MNGTVPAHRIQDTFKIHSLEEPLEFKPKPSPFSRAHSTTQYVPIPDRHVSSDPIYTDRQVEKRNESIEPIALRMYSSSVAPTSSELDRSRPLSITLDMPSDIPGTPDQKSAQVKSSPEFGGSPAPMNTSMSSVDSKHLIEFEERDAKRPRFDDKENVDPIPEDALASIFEDTFDVSSKSDFSLMQVDKPGYESIDSFFSDGVKQDPTSNVDPDEESGEIREDESIIDGGLDAALDDLFSEGPSLLVPLPQNEMILDDLPPLKESLIPLKESPIPLEVLSKEPIMSLEVLVKETTPLEIEKISLETALGYLETLDDFITQDTPSSSLLQIQLNATRLLLKISETLANK